MSKQSSCGCHGGETCEASGLRSIIMVGNPNVGKSALFNRLTGSYVTVSNYPGTTVEVSQGRCKIDGEEFSVEDTPGMYSLLPITEEERVSRDILLAGKADVVCVWSTPEPQTDALACLAAGRGIPSGHSCTQHDG